MIVRKRNVRSLSVFFIFSAVNRKRSPYDVANEITSVRASFAEQWPGYQKRLFLITYRAGVRHGVTASDAHVERAPGEA